MFEFQGFVLINLKNVMCKLIMILCLKNVFNLILFQNQKSSCPPEDDCQKIPETCDRDFEKTQHFKNNLLDTKVQL